MLASQVHSMMLRRTAPRAFSAAAGSLRGLPLDGTTINENVKSAKVRICIIQQSIPFLFTRTRSLELPAYC